MSFTNSLTITSQFSFCGLPIRLDSYRGCAIGCTYCFAIHRGGNVPPQNIVSASPKDLENCLAGSEPAATSPLRQMLARKVPIHFGGMSDPFQPAERKVRATEAILDVLAKFRHPTVISTKGALCSEEKYIEKLMAIGTVVVQFSFSTLRDRVARLLEPRSEGPSALRRAAEKLTRRGIAVTCRWQPYIPGISETPQEFVSSVARCGMKHVAIEHLKIPVESNVTLPNGQNNTLIARIRDRYREAGAARDGREFILNPEQKVQVALECRRSCKENGMTFGAGDNDLQYLSDTEACCSGVDQFPGFENVYRFNIATAVRRGVGRQILFSDIAHEWRPTGSVDRFMNSKSRLSRRLGLQGSMEDHIRYRWNQPEASGGPLSYFRVQDTGRRDAEDMRIYRFTP